jgi:hypothetical protein
VYIGKIDCNCDSVSQPDTGNAMESLADRYCSISDAMKLISEPFDGDKRKLKEFADNVNHSFRTC